MRNLLATRALRRGDGVVSMPESRRNERLFGTTGGGRTKSASMGIKLENLEKDYDPRSDTCLKAFVRLCALLATQSAASAPATA